MDIDKNIKTIIQNAIIAELSDPKYEMSKIFFNNGITPKLTNNLIEISNVAFEENTVIAYVPVENYDFYLTYEFEKDKFELISNVDHYPGIHIRYSIFKMINDQLIKKLESKFDIVKDENSIDILVDNKPDRYYLKVSDFIKTLYENRDLIKEVIMETGDKEIWIDVCFNNHYPLTEIYMEADIIEMLNELKMTIVYDIYGQNNCKA